MADPTTSERVSSLRAVAHPVRLRMLSLLTGSAMSAAEIARELGITHANASYHLRTLAKAGQVVEAGEERIRGGTAKRYRYPWERDTVPAPRGSTGGLSGLSSEQRARYVHAAADEVVRRYAGRRPRTDGMDVDAEVWVTPETWNEVFALVQQAGKLVHAKARSPRSSGTVHVSLTMFAFQMEPGS